MSCIHFGGYMSKEDVELADKQKFRYTSPDTTESKIHLLHKMATNNLNALDRASAAGNPMTDTLDLGFLAFDPEPLVRRWLARNPALPVYLLGILEHDADPSIRAYAKFRLKQLEEENEEHQHGNDGKFPGEVDVDLDD